MPAPHPDFSAARGVLQDHVDGGWLAGVSAAVLRDGEPVEDFCTGRADLERGEPLRTDHIHRAFSNTKLITSVLVLRLLDEGRFALDDPVAEWIPSFGRLRVLRPGATAIDDTEPLQHAITIRHLLSHQAGLSHGVFDAGTFVFDAYLAAGTRRPDTTLAGLMDQLATLPLVYQPGHGWQYSMATDVLARLVELITGQSFGQALQSRLFEPAGMVDTGFVLRPDQVPRLAALYRGDVADSMKPGLQRLDETPWPGAYVKPVPRQSGAGGLFTTQSDMLALLQQLRPGQPGLLRPETLAEMMRDQLPPERCVSLPMTGAVASLGFGLGGAVTRQPSRLQPNSPPGEFQWGGLAGTHWFVSPRTGVAGVLMTQRFWSFWHPFWFEYKRAVYDALG
jgi:CubicO group peptidase (beta-lactamase class C family)